MQRMSGKEIDEKSKEIFEKSDAKIKQYLNNRQDMEVIYMNYNQILKNPREELQKIKQLLPDFDIDKGIKVIDKKLYRNRAQN